MKTIKVRREGDWKSFELFKSVLNHSPNKPLSVDEIRKRCRVLDFIKDYEDEHPNIDDCPDLELEDLDHLTLKVSIDTFPWTQAYPGQLAIIDDVIDAKPKKKPISETAADIPPAPKQG